MNGINRLAGVFNNRKSILLMTHVVGGFPTLEKSRELVLMMAKEGADIIEIQLPFSDPSADGPLIVEANYAALEQKVTTGDVLDMLADIRKETDVPLLIMSYINPIFAYGIGRLINRMKEIGIDGMIVPDYPSDEPELGLIDKCNNAELAFVPLIAPSTLASRMSELAAASDSPFVYTVLRLGVTGRKTEFGPNSVSYLSSVADATNKFVAAGFGIREKAQIDAMSEHAECGIVGSALISVIKAAESEGGSQTIDKARDFIRSLR